VLGWNLEIFGSSHNHCPFVTVFIFQWLLFLVSKGACSLFDHPVSVLAGSPALYIFDLLIYLHFLSKKKERALSVVVPIWYMLVNFASARIVTSNKVISRVSSHENL